jgi:hypothetical protein
MKATGALLAARALVDERDAKAVGVVTVRTDLPTTREPDATTEREADAVLPISRKAEET